MEVFGLEPENAANRRDIVQYPFYSLQACNRYWS